MPQPQTEVPALQRIISQLGGIPVGETEVPCLQQIVALLDQGAIGGGLPDQSGNAGKFLTTDGTDALWAALSGGGDVVASGALTLDSIVLGAGGTSIKVTTTGTGVVTALGVNVGSAGAFVVNGGALGTPSSGTATNLTGLPVSTGISGLGTGIATALGNNANAASGIVVLNGSSQLPAVSGANLTNLTATQVGLGNVTNNTQTQAAIVPNTAPSAGQILAGNAGGTAYAPVSMSGDATLASTGALTIANNAITTAKISNANVTYAKLPSESASTLLGRGDSGAGDTQVISLGSGLSMSGTTLSATGTGSPAGNNTNVQFNNAGAFGGSDEFVFDSTTNEVAIGGASNSGKLRVKWDGVSNEGLLFLENNLGGVSSISPHPGSASNFTQQLPAATGLITLNDNTATLTNKTINGSNNTITNVSLTTGVTGTLPLGNGGTGQTSAQAAINSLMAASGALSQGDVFYYNGTNVVRLAAGTNGHYLQTQGAGANPQWAAAGGGGNTGSILNRAVSTTGTSGSTTAQIPQDNTIPQNTEGTELLTVTITPTSATSKLRIRFSGGFFSASTVVSVSVALFQDSAADALSATSVTVAGGNYKSPVDLEYEMVAGTTSATTFKIRYGPESGATAYFLQTSGGVFSTAVQAQLEVIEYKE